MIKADKQLIFIWLLLLITGIGKSQKRDPSSPFFLIQITDPQFGMFESNKGFSIETALYEKAVKEINRLKPDFVVITGDLVNEKDKREQFEEFKRITSIINPEISVYYSPGNHDIGQAPTQQDIDSFISDFGHDKFSFIHKNCMFIGINSCLIKSEAELLEQKQFDWIEKELLNGKESIHIIIFTHYPFFIRKYDEAETYSNIPINTRNKYISLFKEYNVDAVFAGHLHDTATARYGNMEMITTSSVGKPLAKAPSGIRIIKVYPDRIESDYYGLDEIPSSVDFLP